MEQMTITAKVQIVATDTDKVLYSTLREKFGLKSQMAQSFKKPQYDLVWNRDYSLTQNCFSVNTLNGRVKLPYFAKGMSKYFDHTIYKFGTAKLTNMANIIFTYQ